MSVRSPSVSPRVKLSGWRWMRLGAMFRWARPKRSRPGPTWSWRMAAWSTRPWKRPSGPRRKRLPRGRPSAWPLSTPGSAKPLDEALILGYAREGRAIITVEEGVLAGGFGSAVLELLNRHGLHGVRIACLGLPVDIFPIGKLAELRRRYGLDPAGLAERFRAFFGTAGNSAAPGSKS